MLAGATPTQRCGPTRLRAHAHLHPLTVQSTGGWEDAPTAGAQPRSMLSPNYSGGGSLDDRPVPPPLSASLNPPPPQSGGAAEEAGGALPGAGQLGSVAENGPSPYPGRATYTRAAAAAAAAALAAGQGTDEWGAGGYPGQGEESYVNAEVEETSLQVREDLGPCGQPPAGGVCPPLRRCVSASLCRYHRQAGEEGPRCIVSLNATIHGKNLPPPLFLFQASRE